MAAGDWHSWVRIPGPVPTQAALAPGPLHGSWCGSLQPARGQARHVMPWALAGILGMLSPKQGSKSPSLCVRWTCLWGPGPAQPALQGPQCLWAARVPSLLCWVLEAPEREGRAPTVDGQDAHDHCAHESEAHAVPCPWVPGVLPQAAQLALCPVPSWHMSEWALWSPAQ